MELVAAKNIMIFAGSVKISQWIYRRCRGCGGRRWNFNGVLRILNMHGPHPKTLGLIIKCNAYTAYDYCLIIKRNVVVNIL